MSTARLFSRAVGLLSNLLGFKDGRQREPDPADFAVRRILPAELEQAVRIILAPPGGHTEPEVIGDFIELAKQRQVDLTGIHVSERRSGKPGKFVAAALPVISPGRTMLILTPSAPQDKAAQAALRAVIDALCEYGVARGVHLAQSLIDPTDVGLDAVFASEKFDRMAELQYLHVIPRATVALPEPPAGVRLIPYTEATHDLFGRAIIGSYEGSLDCPALNGLREVDDILAGHMASGTFDPSLWFALIDVQSEPLGVLCLSESMRGDAMELVYLGLLPAARGRRLGEFLMRHAIATASARGQERLSLAVDSRNTPALKLYYRHGMSRIGTKLALLRDLRLPRA